MAHYNKKWLERRKDATLRRLLSQLSPDDEKAEEIQQEIQRRNKLVNLKRMPDEELREEKSRAFDKWCWESGSSEDRQRFEELDEEEQHRLRIERSMREIFQRFDVAIVKRDIFK